ncbi:outer membrane lipoprotein Blc [Methyloparacoccus murrellii]
MKLLSIIILVFLIASMSYLMFGKLGIPDGVSAVQNFDAKRFAGTWYEIARLDHGFEKGMSHVTADYQPRDDGGFRVVNKGFNTKTGHWESNEAKAFFIDTPDVGRLKVSFFGPFYGSYNVIDLDPENYRYAMVTGPNTRFFWILSRDKTLDNPTMQRLVQKAIGLGFKLEKLVYVDQKDETVPAPGAAPAAPAPAP